MPRLKDSLSRDELEVANDTERNLQFRLFSGIVVKGLDMSDLLRAPLSPLPGGDVQFPERLSLFLTNWIDKSPEYPWGR
jgi:hypothetical protein